MLASIISWNGLITIKYNRLEIYPSSSVCFLLQEMIGHWCEISKTVQRWRRVVPLLKSSHNGSGSVASLHKRVQDIGKLNVFEKFGILCNCLLHTLTDSKTELILQFSSRMSDVCNRLHRNYIKYLSQYNKQCALLHSSSIGSASLWNAIQRSIFR